MESRDARARSAGGEQLGRGNRWGVATWTLLLASLSATGLAQQGDALVAGNVRVDEAEITTRGHFTRAEQAVRESLWEEAIDALLRAADAEGDKVLPLPPESDVPGGDRFTRYVTVRRHVQLQLASLARQNPAALPSYRRRVDPIAHRAFQEALARRDPYLWELLLRQYLLSSSGDEALRQYGETQLELGHHHLARAAWEQQQASFRTFPAPLAAPPATPTERVPRIPVGRSWWLTFRAAGRLDQIDAYDWSAKLVAIPTDLAAFPDTPSSLSDIAARLVLVSILSGDIARADWELARFRRRFPEAVGELAGRRAPWPKLLGDLLDASRTWPERRTAGDWTQFAANLGREGRAPRAVEIADRLRWQVALSPISLADDSRDAGDRSTAAPAALLPFHPIVWGPYVALQDGEGVRVWQASTGAPAFSGDERAVVLANPVPAAWLASPDMRVTGVPRFPIASMGSTLWARVGAPWLSSDRPPGSDLHPARIVALDLAAEGRAQASWPLDAERFGEEWTWEGPPVCVDGRVYVGLRRCDPVQAQSHVACFDASTGALRWRRFVAAASAPRARRAIEWTQHLLTWYEGRLFYHARVGVVACLNPHDGVVEWLTRYPRAEADLASTEQDESYRRRDLTPCLVHQGLVLVAAADHDRLFALEAATGQLVWIAAGTGAVDAVHLLGVAEGHVLASGRSLSWIDVGTGQVRCQFPPAGTPTRGAARSGPQGYGRGLLAGSQVWWPTRDRLLVFHAAPEATPQGWHPRAVRQIDLASHGATGGNLAAAGGMLFIAGPDRLYAFGE